jgi:hypothetical protein
MPPVPAPPTACRRVRGQGPLASVLSERRQGDLSGPLFGRRRTAGPSPDLPPEVVLFGNEWALAAVTLLALLVPAAAVAHEPGTGRGLKRHAFVTARAESGGYGRPMAPLPRDQGPGCFHITTRGAANESSRPSEAGHDRNGRVWCQAPDTAAVGCVPLCLAAHAGVPGCEDAARVRLPDPRMK